MKQKKKLQIAKACHAAHNVICRNNARNTIPWEEKSPEHHAIVIDSIEKILSGEIMGEEDAHFNFVKMKQESGWKYGENYSTREKTNPRLCEWGELYSLDRMKEEMFFSIVSSFKK